MPIVKVPGREQTEAERECAACADPRRYCRRDERRGHRAEELRGEETAGDDVAHGPARVSAGRIGPSSVVAMPATTKPMCKVIVTADGKRGPGTMCVWAMRSRRLRSRRQFGPRRLAFPERKHDRADEARNETAQFLRAAAVPFWSMAGHRDWQGWCERGDSNPHGFRPLDPKSSASANSATFAKG